MDDDALIKKGVDYLTLQECEEYYDSLRKKIDRVYQLFVEFYGEDRVDLQGINSKEVYLQTLKDHYFTIDGNIENDYYAHENCFYVDESYKATIYVHWPECIIENERHNTHLIKDLYAKLSLTHDGKMCSTFTLTRTTYSKIEWLSDYAHSHICGIPVKDFSCNDEAFSSPCLGTGPIRDTIANLFNAFDINIWRLFCLELDLYVHTESLTGTPYKYLENIGRNTSMQEIPYATFYKPYIKSDVKIGNINKQQVLNKFVACLLKQKASYIKPAYSSKEGYFVGFNALLDVVRMSNDFINCNLVTEELLDEFMIDVLYNVKNTGFSYYQQNNSRLDLNALNKHKVFTFKNKDIMLNVYDDNTKLNYFKILDPVCVKYILFTLNNIYNCNLTFKTYGGKTYKLGENCYEFL
jgi:hypothetical protein